MYFCPTHFFLKRHRRYIWNPIMIKFWWHLLVQLNCWFPNLEVLFKYDVKCLLFRSNQNRPPFWVGWCCSFVKLHIAILFPLCDVCYDLCVTRCSLRLCFRVFVRRYIFICLREFYIKCWLCRLKINTTGTTSETGIKLAPVFEGSYFSIFSFLCWVSCVVSSSFFIWPLHCRFTAGDYVLGVFKLRPVSCVPMVASFSGLSIHNCTFDFLLNLICTLILLW